MLPLPTSLPFPRPTTILFDLDDTLFDHANTARAALANSTTGLPEFQAVDLEVLYQQYSEILEEIHPRVLAGEFTPVEARRLRFQRLLAPYGYATTLDELDLFVVQHYGSYQRLRRPVPGALELLHALKPHYRIGIVTNNRTAEQQEKLAQLGMTHLIDALITSEDVGVPKPNPHIYQVALERLQSRAPETVMVGDNWTADVIGALEAGIRPLWLNRFGATRPLPHVEEITSLEPLAATLLAITGQQ
ncbi:HAD family hydrolase [Hymenobacter sp. BT186]|uniref:HAD family hydrolase n=1 Tax=Hymenobacter telluris TaxID=2816474 RepID=A0A939EXD3_9BACT|nr:HAD family hydrolase [Hymenobacter telluris]MBO0359250.1 HAD family hydrolase [Hymenobacter telluris]MBW3375276.1 HAD family hydrolase [Hymenobacter norwichensis]